MRQIRSLMGAAVLSLAGSVAMPALAQNIATRPDGRADLVWLDQFGNLLYYWAVPGSAWQSTEIDNFEATVPGTGAQRGLGAAIAVRPWGWLSSEGEADIAAVDLLGGLHYYSSGRVPLCLLVGGGTTCGPDTTVSWTPSSSSWVAAGRVAFSAPALAVRPNGEADIVVQGPDNSLMHYHAFPGTTWVPDQIAGSNTTYLANPGSGTPAIVVLPTGEVAVAALGSGNSLLFYQSTTPAPTAADPNPVSSWSAPQTIPMQGTMAPPPESGFVLSGQYMAVRSTGEVDVVGMGAGGSLLYFSSTPPYSNWTNTTIPGPGTTMSNPVITVRSVDRPRRSGCRGD